MYIEMSEESAAMHTTGDSGDSKELSVNLLAEKPLIHCSQESA